MSVFFNRPFPKWPGRVAWISLALPSIWLTAAGIPFRYGQLVNQNQWFLRELDLNVAPEKAAFIVVGLELLIGLVFFVSGAFLIRFKSNDRLGVIAAFAFLASAATIPGMTDAVIDETMTTRWLGWAGFVYSLRALSATLSILLFYVLPDGRFVPWWTKYLAPIWVVLNVGWLFFPHMPFSVVYGETFRATEVASIIFVTIWWLTGLAAQVARFRLTTAGVARQQLKWVAFGMGLAGLGNLSYLFIRPLHTLLGFSSDLYVLGRPAISAVFFTCLPVCITVAIFRYRLWDIDLVINRTLVYGVLSVLIIGLYALIVGGLGSLFEAQGNFAISLLAAGFVAVLFQPARDWLQRGANRLMFGRRDDPVGMLTDLARRLEGVAAPQAVLPTLIETIAVGLKLPYVALQAPPDGEPDCTLVQFGQPVGNLQVVPLLYQHQEIGRLLVSSRSPGERLSSADEQLLAIIAPLAATTIQAVQLSEALQASRREIVTSREEERRRLRRDLHDGLGPVLASVALQADTARELVDLDVAETKQLLDNILSEAQNAVTDIRRLVYGLRPPALDELGLVSAIRQAAQMQQMRVTVEAEEPLPALPAAIEVAAYRIVLEAVTNAARHGQARNCEIMIDVEDGLSLSITDDGLGLPERIAPGVGLISMRERVAELDGTFDIQTLSAGGTEIKVYLPLG